MSNIIFMARLTDQGDFAAVHRAEHLLDQQGFSVGIMQRGSSRGILFGDYDIQKWRNLNVAERAALHGILDGDRSSHAQIEIWDPAPLEAVRALADALESQPNTVLTKRPPLARTFQQNSPTDIATMESRSSFPQFLGGFRHA